MVSWLTHFCSSEETTKPAKQLGIIFCNVILWLFMIDEGLEKERRKLGQLYICFHIKFQVSLYFLYNTSKSSTLFHNEFFSLCSSNPIYIPQSTSSRIHLSNKRIIEIIYNPGKSVTKCLVIKPLSCLFLYT